MREGSPTINEFETKTNPISLAHASGPCEDEVEAQVVRKAENGEIWRRRRGGGERDRDTCEVVTTFFLRMIISIITTSALFLTRPLVQCFKFVYLLGRGRPTTWPTGFLDISMNALYSDTNQQIFGEHAFYYDCFNVRIKRLSPKPPNPLHICVQSGSRTYLCFVVCCC